VAFAVHSIVDVSLGITRQAASEIATTRGLTAREALVRRPRTRRHDLKPTR
jgi:hypothetical protein